MRGLTVCGVLVMSAWVVDRAAGQAGDTWREREFGVGVVAYAAMGTYAAVDVIRVGPAWTADTVAVLNRDSLCFMASGRCVRSYDRMIEYGYEIPGFAIIAFTRDSSWARVTLDPANRGDPPTGWVAINGGTVTRLLWSEILPRHGLTFIHPDSVRFFSGPEATAAVGLSLVVDSRGPDYFMRPLKVQGRWLMVEVESPSTFCRYPAPVTQRDTVWIEYLTPRWRPRVFYSTRGC